MKGIRPAAASAGGTVPGRWRVVVKTTTAVLAGAALAALAVLFALARVHEHREQGTARANEAAATRRAAATAQSFYRQLLAADRAGGPPTSAQLDALTRGRGISALAPTTRGGVVTVDFRVSQGYAGVPSFEGGAGLVQICYIATLPATPDTHAPTGLRQTACPGGAYGEPETDFAWRNR